VEMTDCSAVGDKTHVNSVISVKYGNAVNVGSSVNVVKCATYDNRHRGNDRPHLNQARFQGGPRGRVPTEALPLESIAHSRLQSVI